MDGGKIPRSETAEQKIVRYLHGIAPEEATPKTISRMLRINHGSVKRELSRILARKLAPIVRTRRGWYRHKLDVDVVAKLDRTKRIGLHGIKLEGTCLQANTGYFLAREAERKYRRRGYHRVVFEDREVKVTVHEKGLVEVWLNASDHPIDFHQFDRFQSWLKGALHFVATWSWTVKQLALNVDTRELALDGISSVKLTVFRNAWFQVYQRGEDVVRFETHMLPSLGMEEAIMILRQLVETRIPQREGAYEPSKLENDPAVR